ncbi:unnamed protein product [Soboliphyme baturini]|uniref:RUN domain-containing protein n=1 Tax=Soboliphyme baturini TaxID=241478 RepID=A0A183J243_9BILA|nr:unnamed protein product [Soboliphyme baturini]
MVKKDFHSIYSRLVLCKTFKLDEDAKVLTPEETLFNSVQLINYTHDLCSASPDVKFRTLMCLGLNEQSLHLWFEIFCSSHDIVEKWYCPCSFIRSPAWVQIKCDLRVLSHFSFNLSADSELTPRFQRCSEHPLKESVREMLVKHHLFSWEL